MSTADGAGTARSVHGNDSWCAGKRAALLVMPEQIMLMGQAPDDVQGEGILAGQARPVVCLHDRRPSRGGLLQSIRPALRLEAFDPVLQQLVRWRQRCWCIRRPPAPKIPLCQVLDLHARAGQLEVCM